MEPRAGLEPATCRLRSVNQPNVTDSYGQISCSVLLTFRASSHVSKLLPSAMVCHLGVHQIVHQVFARKRVMFFDGIPHVFPC